MRLDRARYLDRRTAREAGSELANGLRRAWLGGLGAALVCALGAAAAPGKASAATVGYLHECETCEFPPSGCEWCDFPPWQIAFHARPGEVNDVTVTRTSAGVVFADPAGGLTAGERCTGGGSTVTCEGANSAYVVLRLGDMADRVRAASDVGSFYVHAEAGDDQVEVDGWPRIDPGTGDDLVGGPSMWSGVAVYAHRTHPVTVTLGDGVPTTGNGETGENDTIADGIRDVHGGRAGDTLTGDDGYNYLYGEGGADVMSGRGGSDYLYAEQEPTRMDGGADGDFLGPGFHLGDVRGGPGHDRLGERWSHSPHVLTLDDQANDGPVWGAESPLSSSARLESTGNVHSDVEELAGGLGSDLIIGDGDANHLEGNGEADAIAGGGGPDTISGGNGGDALWARDGAADTVRCGDGIDTAVLDSSDTQVDCERLFTGTDVPASPNPETVRLPPYEPKPAGYGQSGPGDTYQPVYGSPGNPFAAGTPAPTAPSGPLGRPPRSQLAPADVTKVKLDAVLRRVKGRREWVISGRARGAGLVVLQADAKPFDGRYRRVKATPATRSGFFRFIGLRPRRATRYRVLIGEVATRPVTARGL